MTDCKTVRLSYKDICLMGDALAMATAQERVDAERYEHSAKHRRDEEYRDELLLAAADCRKRAEEYYRAYEALRAGVDET